MVLDLLLDLKHCFHHCDLGITHLNNIVLFVRMEQVLHRIINIMSPGYFSILVLPSYTRSCNTTSTTEP